MPVLPAICDACGAVFASGFAVGSGASGSFAGNKSGPCPVCGGMGSVPDGFYEVVGNTITLMSSWTPDRLQSLAAALVAAKGRPDSQAAAMSAIGAEPELLDAMKALVGVGNPAVFWAFIAALLAAIGLLGSCQGDTTIVDKQTVIERVVTAPARTIPASRQIPGARPPLNRAQRRAQKRRKS